MKFWRLIKSNWFDCQPAIKFYHSFELPFVHGLKAIRCVVNLWFLVEKDHQWVEMQGFWSNVLKIGLSHLSSHYIGTRGVSILENCNHYSWNRLLGQKDSLNINCRYYRFYIFQASDMIMEIQNDIFIYLQLVFGFQQ